MSYLLGISQVFTTKILYKLVEILFYSESVSEFRCLVVVLLLKSYSKDF